MKILHAVHGYLPEHDGGTERYVQAIADAQCAAGHEVVVASGSYSDRYDGFVECPTTDDGPRIFRISQTGSYAERWDHGDQPEIERALASLIDEVGADLVHVHHWIRLSRGVVRAARSRGVPVVLTAHDLTASCPRYFRVRPDAPFCERPLAVSSCIGCVLREPWHDDRLVAANIEAYAHDMLEEIKACTTIVAPSQAHAEALARFTNSPVANIRVVPHPRLETFPDRGADRGAASANEPPERLRIAHWGHLIDYKGTHVLLDALNALQRHDAIDLVLWGRADDPDYAKKIQDASRDLRVDRRESFSREDLAGLQADLAVFPSLAHESWSFVVDEALALGIPVLASARGAPPERIGDAGATFTPGDSDALAVLLASLVDNPRELEDMKLACRASGTAIEDHCTALAAIYDEVCRNAPAAIGFDIASKIPGARLRRALEDRAAHLSALHAAAEEEVEGTRKDAEDSYRRAVELEIEKRVLDETIARMRKD